MADEVCVRFRFTDTIDPRQHASDLQVLSPEERERADRFAFEQDRVAFAAAHALLRRVLSECHPLQLDAWTFAPDPGGKPALSGDAARTNLRFNLAHTRGLVACAVARGHEVGIDVESLARTPEGLDIADRFFSNEEIADLRSCAASLQAVRFLELWTLKESYIKGIGRGLSQPLDSFYFRFDGEASLGFESSAGGGSAWQFALFAPGARFRMAIAVPAAAPTAPRLVVRDDAGGPSPPLLRVSPALALV